MIEVFRESGFEPSIRARPGSIQVEFSTSLTEEAIRHFEERDRSASVNAVQAFLAPESVAVIGASRDPSTIAGQLFRNLLLGGFEGPVYPVNPHASVVQGVPAYPSIADVPQRVDLAFIVLPSPLVNDAARQCAGEGVRGLVVISSGFAEVGGEGLRRQAELVSICRGSGMRLIGPNCLGLLNTDPAVSLNGTFASIVAPAGSVGFLSQSGAVGLAVMERAAGLGLGLSSFVSVGNKADISSNDLISWWNDDDRTDVILLYLESFGNPRRFARLARDISRRKPIVAVKSGRSSAGARAVSSHTGALLATSDVTVDALFQQSGVIRTNTLEEMFDVATLLAHQPCPDGDRVAILTNAGGLGILCADTCEANGLVVPELTESTAIELRTFLPGEASVSNPVDMIASATGEDYGRAIRSIAADDGIDAIIVIFIPPLAESAGDVGRNIASSVGSLEAKVPVVTAFMSSRGLPEELIDGTTHTPSFMFPEQAAIALARAASYGAWRRHPLGEVPRFVDVRTDEAMAIVAAALENGGGWLPAPEVARLLSCYGIPVVASSQTSSPEDVGALAAGLGGSIALKAFGRDIVHKTELGAVRLDVSPQQAEREARAMLDRLRASGRHVEGFEIQPMIDSGVEMLVGVVNDDVFGPVVACGAGGTAVELLKDVSVRITPLTTLDASEMIRSLATFPLLDGYRGMPKADVAALEDLLLRVGSLVEAHPDVAEMDCNPVIVGERGALVVDARIRLQAAAPAAPIAARR
jgi:acetyl coenzyme A synthetase (ADP forming)-like protein